MSIKNIQHAMTSIQCTITNLEAEIRSLEAKLIGLRQTWCLKKSFFEPGSHITWEGKRKTYRAIVLGYNYIDLETTPEIECQLINREGLKGRVITLKPEEKSGLRLLTDDEIDDLYRHH